MSSNPSNPNAHASTKNGNNNWNGAPQQGTQQPWSGANARPFQPQTNIGKAPTAQVGQQQQQVYPPNSGMYTAPGYSNQYVGGYTAQQAPPAPANTGGTSLSKAAQGSNGGQSVNQVGIPPPYAQQQQGYMMYPGQVRPGAPPPQYYQQQQQQYNPQFNRNYPVGNWQPNYPAPVYHPTQSAGVSGAPKVPANPPRRRGPSLITTKDGKKIEFASSTKANSSKAGSSMLAQAQALMASNKSAKQLREEETKKKEEEEKLERERIEKEEKEKREKVEKELQEKERLEKEAQARREAEEKSRKEKETKERRAREKNERLRKEKLEREQRVEKERQEEQQKPRGFRPGGGLRPGGSRRLGSALSTPSMENLSISRKVYTKADLLSFRDKEICQIKPDDLPDFTIRPFSSGNNQGPRNRGGGGGGGGRPDSNWSRGQSQPKDKSGGNNAKHKQTNAPDSQWGRGQAPPVMKNRQGQRGQNHKGYVDPNTPFEPLGAPSENRWTPKKDDSAFALAEKGVMAILNKMTKEKFGKLSQKMCELEISSNEILSMIIHSIYEKAIDEPRFGDIYAQLCILLAKKVSDFEFIKIVPTDEQKGLNGFKWSNNVSSSDSEVLGPFTSPQECIEIALDKDTELKPMERGDKQMSIEHCRIIEGTFIKILSHDDKFYAVCFPLDKADECGQQLSPKIFSTEEECMANARKKNSFKSILLNKCQDEFNKQDIYAEWKKEKKEFDKIMGTLSKDVREVKKEDLMFRRMKIKKQMLGNIKFIGELYKMTMIKEHIMHFCVRALLKFNCTKDGNLFEMEDDEMDEEDHEALCNLFITIGKTFDVDNNRLTVNIYFKKMIVLSVDNQLSSRYRFMYKDLIELRANRWKSRRQEETAKTLTEIRKDVEREERQQAQEHRSGPNKQMGNRRGSNYNQSDRRSSTTKQSKGQSKSSEPDGWAVVSAKPGARGYAPAGALPSLSSIRSVTSKPEPKSQAPPQPKLQAPPKAKSQSPSVPDEQKAPELSDEKLELKIKNMRTEFLTDQSNTEDVFYTMKEMMGTPNYGRFVVEKNMDFAFECKDPEREGVIALLTLLYTKNKLSSKDFETGMADMIEFVDSFAVDIPKACQYLGEVLSACLQMKALSKEWLKEKSALAAPGYSEKIMTETDQALSRMFNRKLDSL